VLDSPSPSLSYKAGILVQCRDDRSATLTKREKASLNSETCSSVSESA